MFQFFPHPIGWHAVTCSCLTAKKSGKCSLAVCPEEAPAVWAPPAGLVTGGFGESLRLTLATKDGRTCGRDTRFPERASAPLRGQGAQGRGGWGAVQVVRAVSPPTAACPRPKSFLPAVSRCTRPGAGGQILTVKAEVLAWRLPGAAQVSPPDSWHRPGEVFFLPSPQPVWEPVRKEAVCFLLSAPPPPPPVPPGQSSRYTPGRRCPAGTGPRLCQLSTGPLSGESSPQGWGPGLSLCPHPTLCWVGWAMSVGGRWNPCLFLHFSRLVCVPSSVPGTGLAASDWPTSLVWHRALSWPRWQVGQGASVRALGALGLDSCSARPFPAPHSRVRLRPMPAGSWGWTGGWALSAPGGPGPKSLGPPWPVSPLFPAPREAALRLGPLPWELHIGIYFETIL